MKLTNRVILIVAGTSELGQALGRQLVAAGNDVILTGRDAARREAACRGVGASETYELDVSDAADIDRLAAEVRASYPNLSLVINCAGILTPDGWEGRANRDYVDREVAVNFTSAIHVAKAFLPLLEEQPEAGILQVTAALAYTPLASAAVYSAAKAGLHSYVRSLRHTLRGSPVRVYEALPSVLDTRMTRHLAIPGKLPVDEAARLILRGVEDNREEITPAAAGMLRQLSRWAPSLIFAKLNPTVPVAA